MSFPAAALINFISIMQERWYIRADDGPLPNLETGDSAHVALCCELCRHERPSGRNGRSCATMQRRDHASSVLDRGSLETEQNLICRVSAW
jgi:hypothetical protein